MTQLQWEAFSGFRTEFKKKCTEWEQFSEELLPLQKAAAQKDTPDYPVETPVVYNCALDDITKKDAIRLIVIGDNPGKNEQLKKNRRYLVGQSGKIAEGFFRRNPELLIDFRKNVIILNKTPVHTAKTAHLKYLIKNGSPRITELIRGSQIWMARKTAELHRALCTGPTGYAPELWLVGYAEIKKGGIFVPYRETMTAAYQTDDKAWQNVFVYQHFSMNRFLIDLSAFEKKHDADNRKKALEKLGTAHKNELF
ncbi:MAG: hypothetical protein LKF96_11675 [Treponema sp.]|jgi:hypothetical protein|nr:hypothetical protein [Treponema sp.]